MGKGWNVCGGSGKRFRGGGTEFAIVTVVNSDYSEFPKSSTGPNVEAGFFV